MINCTGVSSESNGSCRARFVSVQWVAHAADAHGAEGARDRLCLRAARAVQTASLARWSHGPVR